MSQMQLSRAELKERLVRIEKELIRARKLYEETNFYDKLKALSYRIDNLEGCRQEIRTALGMTEEIRDHCDCCKRTGLALQRVEETASLCMDCAIMYQSLWRVERSVRIPNVALFLEEVRSGDWKPK